MGLFDDFNLSDWSYLPSGDVSSSDLNLMGDLGGETLSPSDWTFAALLNGDLSYAAATAGPMFTSLLDKAKTLLSDPKTATAGAAGLAALMNSMNKSSSNAPVGYQGGIPAFTAERAQTTPPAYTPYAQFDPAKAGAYRPGQGGISYFAPMKYTATEPAATNTTTPATTTETASGTDGMQEGGTQEGTWDSGIERAYADGGIAMLAKGGRYIKGPGDGVSDSVPAVIESARGGQPAKLADGEFVFPARVVAEIGNGSNEAGARKLYALLDKIEARAKGAKRGKPSGADKELNKLA